MTAKQTRFEGLTEILRVGLGARLDPNAENFLDMFSDDCVFEAPYAPSGFIRRIDGRDALERYLMAIPDLIRIDDFLDLQVSELVDPNKVVLEFRGKGEGCTGNPYDQKWISVIETLDGKIIYYADYWDPLTTLSAVGDARPQPVGEGFTYA